MKQFKIRKAITELLKGNTVKGTDGVTFKTRRNAYKGTHDVWARSYGTWSKVGSVAKFKAKFNSQSFSH